jgi:hypothetical protein
VWKETIIGNVKALYQHCLKGMGKITKNVKRRGFTIFTASPCANSEYHEKKTCAPLISADLEAS